MAAYKIVPEPARTTPQLRRRTAHGRKARRSRVGKPFDRGNLRSMRHKTGYGIAGYAACGITGDPSPGEADLRLTRRLNVAARILQIQMLDHVIIGHPTSGRQGYFNFKEAGTIG
jgi:RadC-like JAB domain-containing protein